MKLSTLVIVLVLVPASQAPAQTQPVGEEAVIERILELRRQIDELLATLPPAARAELGKRLGACPRIRTAPSEEGLGREADPQGRVFGALGAPPDLAPAASPPVALPPSPEPALPEPVVQAPPAAEPPLRRRLTRGPHCNFLAPLDGNGDGKISALDRYWRHLFLWSDNGDRTVQEAEVASAYERNVREIAVDLSTFIRKKGTIGEIRMRSAGGSETPLLDVRGDGFGGADDAVLVVDATRLKRGSGPELLSAAGEPVEGFQPFREGWQLRADGGEVTVFRCP